MLLTLVLKLKRELYGNDERGETISGKRGVARASYLLRHTIYDGARTEGEYKPEGFRALLLTAGFICFDKIVARLDLFGTYWQRIYPEYKKKDRDFWRDKVLMVG